MSADSSDSRSGILNRVKITSIILIIITSLVALILGLYALAKLIVSLNSVYVYMLAGIEFLYFIVALIYIFNHYKDINIMLRKKPFALAFFSLYFVNFAFMGYAIGELIVDYYKDIFSGLLTFLAILLIQLPGYTIGNSDNKQNKIVEHLRDLAIFFYVLGSGLLFMGLATGPDNGIISMKALAISFLFIILAFELLILILARSGKGNITEVSGNEK